MRRWQGGGMRWIPKLAAALFALTLQACAAGSAPPQAATRAEVREPVTILVSIDAFRADYLDRGVTPNLSALAAGGVRAPMRPSFPTKTFPNHYTLVTGLRPDRNGIIANRMEDPRRPGKQFSMASTDPFWWDEAEPIWVAAEKANIRTAALYWPGSMSPIGGAYASDWQAFAHDMPDANRVNMVIDLLRRPAETRPRFVTIYFNTVDDVGHDHGPDAAETNAAVASVDVQIGRLRDMLAALGQPANLIIVSDHGMANTSPDRVIDLSQVADPASWRVIDDGPFVTVVPTEGQEAALEKALLAPHDHMTCWRKEEIPARFHYGKNPRVSPYFCLAQVGWLIQAKPVDPSWDFNYGNHGWDNEAAEMRALFVANGPAFRPGATLPEFDNVDVYPLLRDLIGLPAAKDVDGTDAVFAPAMAAHQ